MSFSSSSKGNISLKKLVGKAHTSNNLEFFNESKSSGITVNANAVFGEALPASPTETLGQATDGIVELIRLTATPLPESIVNGKFHGFKLSLPSDYSTTGKSSERGSGVYVDGKDIHTTNGEIQLVPPSFGDIYEAKLFYGGTGEDRIRIPLLDNRNWYLDYFNGILFQENPPADSNENPEYVEAYIYIGKMASDRFSEGAGGGAGATDLNGLGDVSVGSATNGQFLVHNGVQFVNRALAVGDLPSLSIADLSDVNALTDIEGGNILAWDASENAFVYQTPSAVYTDEEARNAAGTALANGIHTAGIAIANDDANDRINVTLDLGQFSIGDLSNVNLANAGVGKILKFDGSNQLVVADETDTQLSDEQVQDIVGGMVSGNTTTDITVTYQDNGENAGKLDFVVDAAIARLADPDFTGTPTAPTPVITTDDTQIATTAFVHSLIDSDITALNFGNIIGSDTGDFLSSDTSIDALNDVDITTNAPQNGQTIVWNGTNFVPGEGGKTQEQIEEIVGGMVSGNTETDVTVTYQDNGENAGKLDFVVNNTISRIADNEDFTGDKTFSGSLTAEGDVNLTGASFVRVPVPLDNADATTKLYVDTNKQPIDDTLTALAGLTTGENSLILSTANDTFEMTSISDAGKTFIASDTELNDIANVLISGASNAQILVYDSDSGENDNKWKNVTLSGDISIANSGEATITSGAVENSMLANPYIDLTINANTDRLKLGETFTISGTNNEIEVTGLSDVDGSNAGASLTIGLPDDVTIGQDLTVTRDLVVTRNLTVNGTTTTIDTTNLNVEDTIISLNSGISGQANTNDIGFFLNRGTNDPALIYWDEGDDVFKVGTHSGINNEVTDVGGTEGFSLSGLQVETPAGNANDNSVATTAWVTSKGYSTVTSIDDLSDVDVTGRAAGRLLKFDEAGNLIVADGNGFNADTSSLWALDDDGDLYPHGIIDGTLDTGMFAINLSAGSLNINSTDVTLHDILQELSSMNAYTPSTRDAANISDDFFEFDGDGNIIPKAAT